MDNDHQNTAAPANGDVAAPDNQAQAASAARHQLDQIYQTNPPNQTTAQQASPYQRTHAEHFDWRTYHSAWQDYYRRYYYLYYTQQLQTQQQKQGTEAAPAVDEPQDTIDARKTRLQRLRAGIKTSVQDHARTFRRSHHFVPLISAIAVGLIFLFLQFNSIVIANVKAYVSPGQLSEQSAAAIDPAKSVAVGPEPRLIIPKINVDVPVDYNITGLSESQILLGLRESAVHYNLPGADAVPGQLGNTIILGHSGNDIFSQGQYKFVFVLLDKMAAGDTFYVHYQGKQYIYKVTEVKVINPDQISALQVGYDKSMVTLVTCTPPGSSFQRRLVFGEQISPDPRGAAPAKNDQKQVQATLPGTSPTLLEQVWQFLFK